MAGYLCQPQVAANAARPRAKSHGLSSRIRRYTAAPQILQQQDHLVIPIRRRRAAINFSNGLRGGTLARFRGLQDASSQISRDKLKLVRRQALQESPGVSLQRSIRTGNQCGNQSVSHGRSPSLTPNVDLSRIMAKCAARRKGAPRNPSICDPSATESQESKPPDPARHSDSIPSYGYAARRERFRIVERSK